MINNPILITGTSSGIGKATALHLVKAGNTVYATARTLESLEELKQAGCETLVIDVTDEQTMEEAVATIVTKHGAVGTLINNAGYGEYGAIEEVPLERMRMEFETNVFGLARLTQLVLPQMREKKQGTIVNMSSMGGRLVLPFGGYYHAAKYAVEAISDALRMEVAPFGISVIIIEPGLITTEFATTATRTLGENAGSGPYAHSSAVLQKNIADNYKKKILTAPPEAVAATIERALKANHPRDRYIVTPFASLAIFIRAVFGAVAWDFLMTRRLRG